MTTEAIFGVLISILIGLCVAFFIHVKEDRDQRIQHARENGELRALIEVIRKELAHVSAEVGSHDTGLRGSLHRFRNEINARLMMLDNQRRGPPRKP
jgi:hypothetical protein